MTQYKNSPLASEQRNVSQGLLLANNQYLINVSGGGSPTGILPVDHKVTGDNGVSPSDGFHLQVSMKSQSTPANQTNAVNASISDGILYTTTDAGGTTSSPHALLKYVIGTAPGNNAKYIDYPISCIQSFGKFSLPSGNLVGFPGPTPSIAHNLVSPAVVNTTGSTLTIPFLFSVSLSSTQYMVFATLDRPFQTGIAIYSTNIGVPLVSGFTVTIFASQGSTPYSGNLNLMVLGIF